MVQVGLAGVFPLASIVCLMGIHGDGLEVSSKKLVTCMWKWSLQKNGVLGYCMILLHSFKQIFKWMRLPLPARARLTLVSEVHE